MTPLDWAASLLDPRPEDGTPADMVCEELFAAISRQHRIVCRELTAERENHFEFRAAKHRVRILTAAYRAVKAWDKAFPDRPLLLGHDGPEDIL